MELPVIRVCGGVVCSTIGSTRLVLNREAPFPLGGGKKHFDMGECFFARCLLVPLLTIRREYIYVEHELKGVINHLIAGVWPQPGVGVHNYLVDMNPEDLYGVGGGVCLSKMLVICEQVHIGDDGVHRV